MIDLLIKLGVPRSSAGDVWLLILFLAAALGLIILIKRRNLGPLLFATYISFAVVSKTHLGFLQSPNAKTGYFIVLLALIYTLFKRFFKVGISGKKLSVWLKTGLFSFSLVGLLSSIILNWYSQKEVGEFFSTLSLGLFRSEEAQFLWMAIPLVIVLIFKYRQ